MGSGEDAQFVFAKYDYTAQGNQVETHNFVPEKSFLVFSFVHSACDLF